MRKKRRRCLHKYCERLHVPGKNFAFVICKECGMYRREFYHAATTSKGQGSKPFQQTTTNWRDVSRLSNDEKMALKQLERERLARKNFE